MAAQPHLTVDKRRGTIYPSPFFDIGQTYMPPTVKELFRWCKYFFYKDTIGAVVAKLAEYPVTDFIYNTDHPASRTVWKELLEDCLGVKPFLIEVGLDYFTYGNTLVSIHFPFTRWIRCPACQHVVRLSDPSFTFRFSNFEFRFSCASCGAHATGEIVDRPIKDKRGIHFVRWDPNNIEIHYNPVTGRSRYRYKIPNAIRRAVVQGNRDILAEIPAVFLMALKAKRDIELSEQNLFHLKRPTLAEQDMGWGKPLIIHSMSRMFYLHVLRRSQEAVALQRILPLEFVFPQANAAQDPYQHVNLSSWQTTVHDEIQKWRQDPNYISVVSVPLGFERLGGDGRALLLGPEIEITNKEIMGGMGVPIEFVFGGLSWSGSSVSLRTLENHFLLYRRLLLRFVNWVKDRLRIYLGLPNVEVGFTEFKMADDIQRKQIVIQLNAANKISDHTLLTELGFDYEKELSAIERETVDRNRIQALMLRAQTQAQGEAQVEQAKYQARAQEVFQQASQAAGLAASPAGGPMGGPGAPGAPPDAAADAQLAQQAALGDATETRAPVAGQAAPIAGGNVVELDASRVAKRWASRIAKLPPAAQQQVLAELRAKMPNMARLVVQLLGLIGPGQTASDAARAMRALPQARPPTRQRGVV